MSIDQVSGAAIDALPLGRLALALSDVNAYLVGGVTRAMFGAEPLAGDDIDVAVDGDLEAILAQLERQGFQPRQHGRFGTASVEGENGVRVDLARTRTERYEHPGALPIVEPASIEEDLARRDFTINTIAVALDAPHLVLDPHGGRRDLKAGLIRVLHKDSFVDDPTRAIRAARYASRLGLTLEPETAELIGATELATISEERRNAELRRLAAEPRPASGFGLLDAWGLIGYPADRLALVDAVVAEAADPAWATLDPQVRVDAVLLAAGHGDPKARRQALDLAEARPGSPSEGERLASRLSDSELLVAAAAGGIWVRDHVAAWRNVTMAISGTDLIEAGIAPGPAIGAGLAEVRRQILDDEISDDRERQLEVALEAARSVG